MKSELIILVCVLLISCDKEDDNSREKVPVLSTTEVTDIVTNAATSGGNITDDGGVTVTTRGVCWSTNENPTVDANKTEDGTGTGSFTSSITDLELNTTYYVRAYATSSAGTGYGSTLTFTTRRGFTDSRDGKVYQTAVIGNQEWMAENLAYAPTSGNYWAYDNNNANVAIYGFLYDWPTAQNVCPTGWHLPSNEEWTQLIDYLGDDSGGKLKATGTIDSGTGLWYAPNTGATNETGFTALPAGGRNENGEFITIDYIGYWWDAYNGLAGAGYAYFWGMGYNRSNVTRALSFETLGLSVRCVRD